MNKRNFQWIIGILIILNLFSLSIIWYGHIKHNDNRILDDKVRNIERPDKKESNFLNKELGLDKEQIKLIRSLRENHIQKIRKTQRLIHKKKRIFIEKAFSNEINDSILNLLADELGELQKELELINKEHIRNMTENLNPEQTEKFKKLFREMMLRADPERRKKPDHREMDRRRPPHIK